MGLSNGLAIAIELNSTGALRLLAERLRLERADDTHLTGPALWVSAGEPDLNYKLMIQEGFHFTPNLYLGFRLDPGSDDYPQGSRLMLRATLLLLEHGRDGVLLFNGEHIILQRLSGQLVLNEDARNWVDGLQLEGEIRLPHERRSLPSPLQ
ncbi:SitI3 family protein [Stigmatella sp. ncwal1]|uniref:SitI3 family protein n=1 Tax=Stigmatella ashevillensis TaxID=2995309 RepID=A0ABT5DIM8_9BACT|nr:SitI3 family protein [Stigmatella ashevillena]MDC0713516.1 SitI3 family protein [Stigmatella ashevillena]